MATGFSFGTKTTAAPSFGTGSITFGTPGSQPQAQFGFGNLATTSTPSLFGTPTSNAGFKLPTTTQATGFAFGGATSSAPATSGLTLAAPVASTGLGFGTSTAPGLSFGATTTSATLTPSSGLTFGSNFTPGTGFSTGLGGTTTAVTQSAGLGGIATTQSKLGGSTSTQKEPPPKEQALPNEFTQLVEQFKHFLQDEKTRSSEVARCSVQEYHKVEAELESLNQQLNHIQNQVLANLFETEQIKYDAAKGLQNIEMAQRTQDTPTSLQYENNAPLNFFMDLSDRFEREMQNLKIKIDSAEKFVKKTSESSVLTSQDLALGLKRLHETFVALAGRMQTVHNQVETQKEAFLNLRKQLVKDNINPFERMTRNTEAMHIVMKTALKTNPPSLFSGPTPFNSISMGSNNVTFAAQQAQQLQPLALNSGLGVRAPLFGESTANNSMFKPTGFANIGLQNSNFQLQKPPTGNKRGKQ